MNSVSRGIRNAFRNSIRTFSIVIILGLSVGLSLSMIVTKQAVEDKISNVKSSIGNTISVSPAGARGFEGGGEPLTVDQLAKVATLNNVNSVSESLSDRLTSTNTSLVSAIEAGSLGARAGSNSGVGFQAPPSGSSGGSTSTTLVNRTFTPPVTITGLSDLSSTTAYGSDTVTYTSGSAIDTTKDENKAVVGKAIAEKNGLTVGSTFTAYSTTITVVGIYDTGNTFANNGVIMSLSALQRLSSQPGAVTSATVKVDSVDNLDSVVAAVKSTLGTSADVVSAQTAAQTAVQPLESVKTLSFYSVLAALIAGAIIILLTMTMIVRERRREIGVMKAIGSSNLKTMIQFMSEAVTLTMLGLIVGLVMSIFAAQPITEVLVNNSSNSTSTGMIAGRGPSRISGVNNLTLRNVENIKTSVKPDILLYGVGTAFLIAIIGSAMPAYLLSKIRPADVMRAD